LHLHIIFLFNTKTPSTILRIQIGIRPASPEEFEHGQAAADVAASENAASSKLEMSLTSGAQKHQGAALELRRDNVDVNDFWSFEFAALSHRRWECSVRWNSYFGAFLHQGAAILKVVQT
jgi:hypothetical protein